MNSSLLEDLLLDTAAEGALVLTATKRLARRLRQLVDQRLGAADRGVWLTPAIHSGDAWLRQTAAALGEGWRLLGTQPARRLWEKIIETESAGSVRELLQVSATARLAEAAQALLAEYGGDPDDYPLTADHLTFLRWRRSYLETLRQEGWMDGAILAATVIAAVERGELPVPKVVWLTGFDDLPPRLRRLAAAFTVHGSQVRELPPAAEPRGELVRLGCADAREEVRRAARWARRLLEGGEGEIGVIVPDLEGYRSLIERIFREEIDPEAQLRPGAGESRFNLSLGEPLAGQGAVVAALEILAAARSLPLAQAGFLLRSPYLGGSQREATARARLDRLLRTAGEPAVSLGRLQRLAEKQEPETGRQAAPLAGAIFHQLRSAVQEQRRFLPGGWASRFAGQLQAVGWPGERPLDSHDFQVVKAFREKVLPQLAAFDLVSGPVERGEALALLRRLAAETEFQAEGAESPVQVVGLLEAAGLRFRHLWVMGLHDGALPAAARPNPFLPVALQVAAGMPHASAEREGAFASRVAVRLFAAAPAVILSHPLRQGDAALLPSPLIRDLPEGEVPLAPSRAPAALWRQAAPPAEELADHSAPPLAAGERVSGGTAILRDQALCPFRAFARHRLGAAALEVPDIGLDPRVRGNLLHKVLEFFWQKTQSQAGLLVLGETARQQRLEECIEEAVQALFPEGKARPAAALLALESDRLRRLLDEWLAIESQRTPFAVLEEEKEYREHFGGVEVVTRIDRMDQLADGSRVVLDYKTGQVDAADLIGERLLEPQLPVYGLGRGGEELAGVAFASLRRGKCAFCGVARSAEVLPKVPALTDWKKAQEFGLDWSELLHRWRRAAQCTGAFLCRRGGGGRPGERREGLSHLRSGAPLPHWGGGPSRCRRRREMSCPIADAAERRAALEPARSCIVQAPAGSGKTELLIQRFLALLAVVERPEEILAITFTRKAAGEMRSRLLEALERGSGGRPEREHEAETWTLARAVLEQDRRLGWNLRENPGRLAIQTIDSFNASLVRRMPWLTRLGGVPRLTEAPAALYRRAAERALERLRSGGAQGEGIARLLAHLDNRLDHLRDLLVGMLARRDQWLRHLTGARGEEHRQRLENALRSLVEAGLTAANAAIPEAVRIELVELVGFAAGNLATDGKDGPLARLAGMEDFPAATADDLPAWHGLAELLLTARNELRLAVDKRCGFPADKKEPCLSMKQRMRHLLDWLGEEPAAVEALARVRDLPPVAYEEAQWQVLRALVDLLPLVVAELWLVFREEGTADFAEIALQAQRALREDDSPSELLLRLDSRLSHILVDEFQDTSHLQFELLQILTEGWSPGDGRTLFLVGDPMQSIYRFREAEVGLFLQARRGGLREVRLEGIRLSANFRSQAGIVDWVNRTFAELFPLAEDAARGAVPLAAAEPVHDLLPGEAVSVHPWAARNDREEAQQVAVLAQQAMAAGESAAVLVRSRSHLAQILPALRAAGLHYQAQDIDLLAERPAARDLVSLTRALLHPDDRLAWLSVLRAPWCGLPLADLHALCGGRSTPIPLLLADTDSLARLTADGRRRAERTADLLQEAGRQRGRVNLRRLVEGCWLALGGPVLLDGAGLEDAGRVLDLLEELDYGGDLRDFQELEDGLGRLFAAPDSEADGRLQVMTIHRAKGLEFDTVILPGLGRRPAHGDPPLLRWLEQPGCGLLLGPIHPRDGVSRDPIYDAIGQVEKEKADLETGAVALRRRHPGEEAPAPARPCAAGQKRRLPAGGRFSAAPALASGGGKVCRPGRGERGRGGRCPPPRRRCAACRPTGSRRLWRRRRCRRRWRRSALPGWGKRMCGSWFFPAGRRIAPATSVQSPTPSWSGSAAKGWSAGRLGVLTSWRPRVDACSGFSVCRGRMFPAVWRRCCGLCATPWPASEAAGSCNPARRLPASSSCRGSSPARSSTRSSTAPLSTRTATAGSSITRPASRAPAGSLKAFLTAESERYQPQLVAYAELFRRLEPQRPVRAGLYFPLADAWCEIPLGTTAHLAGDAFFSGSSAG